IALTDGFRKTYEKKDFLNMIKYLREREPGLKMLEENISLRETLVKGQRAEYMPDISAFASWDYMGRSDRRKDWYIGDSELMEQFGTIGFKIDFPVFDSGNIREKIIQAVKNKEKSVLELEKTYRDLSLELNNAISEYNEYIETLSANIQAVDLSEKSFRLYQDLFETGQVTLLELNDAELMLTNGKLQRETTLYNLNITLAKIERLTAGGDENS
ncbi:MAG: TolC family protein, partial [Candidatus Omnitrophota bacterium]